MRNKLIPICASFVIILSVLACSLASGQTTAQPDLAATITAQAFALDIETITAQAQALQSSNATPAPANATSAPADTAQPADTQPPNNPPQPVNTQGPTSPSKPKNFKANGSAAAITFTLDDNSLNENGFRIYQDGVSAPIASINANPATGGMSYNWPGLACGFKGKFSIRAFNDTGESGSSNSVNGVTVPCAPAKLIANAQGSAISFNWDVGTKHNEDGFRIYQQGVSQPVASRGPNLGAGGTNYDMTGLLCNIVATYSVRAYNSAGESPDSNLIQSETYPCGPSGLKITGISKDTVTYTWTDNATSETGFHVYQDDVLYTTLPAHNGTGTVGSDAFQQCDVNFPVNHVYSIRAFNYAGESVTSEHVGATTPVCGP